MRYRPDRRRPVAEASVWACSRGDEQAVDGIVLSSQWWCLREAAHRLAVAKTSPQPGRVYRAGVCPGAVIISWTPEWSRRWRQVDLGRAGVGTWLLERRVAPPDGDLAIAEEDPRRAHAERRARATWSRVSQSRAQRRPVRDDQACARIPCREPRYDGRLEKSTRSWSHPQDARRSLGLTGIEHIRSVWMGPRPVVLASCHIS